MIENVIDDIQQYSRRNCLFVHGLKEDQDESTDDLVLKLFNEKLGVAVDISMIDRSHRLEPVRGENNLTKQRMKLLNEAQKVVGEGNSWTVDGFIFVKQGRRIIKITKIDDIKILAQQPEGIDLCT